MNDLFSKSISDIKIYFKNHERDLIHHKEFLFRLKNDQRKALNQMAVQIEKNQEKSRLEILRVKALYDHDLSFNKIVCGVDEVGRGPLAGPIVGAAVILREGSTLENIILGIDDSKKKKKKKREELDVLIRENEEPQKIGEITRVSYGNSERDRKRLKEIEPENIVTAVMAIFGDTPTVTETL